MTKKRYNRVFKKGIAAIMFCVLLMGATFALSAVSAVQYHNLIADMEPLKATITDIDLKIHYKGPNEQEIFITYTVDGKVYNREWQTDTTVSFGAGRAAHYSIGDEVDIFYDPQNPERIAAPRSMKVGYFWLFGSLFFLLLALWALFWMLRHHKRFLVTEEEYIEEGLELKRSKLKEKQRKKQEKQKRRKKYAGARRIGRIILIVLGVLVGAFVLYLLFGLLLVSLGY